MNCNVKRFAQTLGAFCLAALGAGCAADDALKSAAERYENVILVVDDDGRTRMNYDLESRKMGWSDGDRLVALYEPSGKGFDTSCLGSGTVSVVDGAVEITASFPADRLPAEDDDWRIFVVHHESAFRGCTSSEVSCTLPWEQTPAENGSFDPRAALIYGYTAQQTGRLEAERVIKLALKYVSAYGIFTLLPPEEMRLPETLVGVRIDAGKPLAGDVRFTDTGELTVDSGVNSLMIFTDCISGEKMFSSLPCDLTDEPATLSLVFPDGVWEKRWEQSGIILRNSAILRHTADMSGGDFYALKGAVLWSETFDGASVVDTGTTARDGRILGEYNLAGEGSGCRLFWDFDRSALDYEGSYALYAENWVLDGESIGTKDNAAAYFSFGGMPLCGARRIALDFDTTATTCTLEYAFDGEWTDVKESLKASSRHISHEIEVPSGAGEFAFRISSGTKTARYYDNFALTVVEAAK